MVVADRVSGRLHLAQQLGLARRPLADREEGRVRIVAIEDLHQLQGVLGIGAVVVGERDPAHARRPAADRRAVGCEVGHCPWKIANPVPAATAAPTPTLFIYTSPRCTALAPLVARPRRRRRARAFFDRPQGDDVAVLLMARQCGLELLQSGEGRTAPRTSPEARRSRSPCAPGSGRSSAARTALERHRQHLAEVDRLAEQREAAPVITARRAQVLDEGLV